jgi:hypothetical protein
MLDEDDYFEDLEGNDSDKADRLDLLVDSIVQTIYNQAYYSETRDEYGPTYDPSYDASIDMAQRDAAQQQEDTDQNVKRDMVERKSMKLSVNPNPTEVEVPLTMSEWDSWSAEKQGATTLTLGFMTINKSMSKEEWEEMSPGDQIAYAWHKGLGEINYLLQAVPRVKSIRRCIGITCQTPRGLPRVIFPYHQA